MPSHSVPPDANSQRSDLAGLLLKTKDFHLIGIDYTPTHIRRKVKDKSFPDPIYLGEAGGAVRWLLRDVANWLVERAARSGIQISVTTIENTIWEARMRELQYRTANDNTPAPPKTR